MSSKVKSQKFTEQSAVAVPVMSAKAISPDKGYPEKRAKSKSSTAEVKSKKKISQQDHDINKGANNKGNHMTKSLSQYEDKSLPEIPELEEILKLPKNVREEAFVRAVCTAHKAKVKASKKVKQNLAWLHTESEN